MRREASALYRLDSGLIAEGWLQEDFLGWLQQLGV